MIHKINWNISGAFCKHKVIIDFFTDNNLFHAFNSISVYDGVSRCKWNGGRMHYDNPPKNEIKEDYYRLGWGINLTFSNFEIDISDPLGNSLLEEFHREGNGIILVNEELRKHIRQNFPKYKLIHSVTGCGLVQELPLRDEDVLFYKRLEEKYDLIIPRCGSSFDKKLRMLDRDKVEIMVNDTCILNCPVYHNHFEMIGEANRKGSEWDDSIAECFIEKGTFEEVTRREKRILGKNYPFDFGTQGILRLLDEGFYNFKIAGRDETKVNFTEDLRNNLIYG